MINESELIEALIKKLREVQGEMTLKMIPNSEEQKEPSNIFEFIELSINKHEEHEKLMNAMTYNSGKLDAYIEILSLLGIKFENPNQS